MKLKTFFLAIGLALVATSCFKTRNCTCTTVTAADPSSGTPASTSVENNSIDGEPIDGGKKNQEAECKSQESSNSSYTKTCVLSK